MRYIDRYGIYDAVSSTYNTQFKFDRETNASLLNHIEENYQQIRETGYVLCYNFGS